MTQTITYNPFTNINEQLAARACQGCNTFSYETETFVLQVVWKHNDLPPRWERPTSMNS